MEKATREARIELALFALAAVAPLLPYVVVLVARGVPPFDLIGDLAWMEYDTRHVWTGDTLVGLSSRFNWSHPGPFFFWVAAPFEKVFGAAGLYAAATFVSGAAAATTVGVTRALAGRAHAIAALVVVTAWFAAFGNVAANPWVRTVVVLPLIAYLVLVSFVARGEPRVAVAAVFFGSIAAQTHVGTVPTVAATGALSLVALAARRRGGLSKREWAHLALAVLLVVVTLVPPLIEQHRAAAGDGNLSRLVHFFRHRTEPYKPISVAVRDWAMATGWLLERGLSCGLARDGAIPFAMRWDEVPSAASPAQLAVAALHVVAVAGGSIVAFRGRDRTSLALLGVGAAGEVLAIVAVRAIIGEVHYSILFSATAASCVAWIGALSAFGTALAGRRAVTATAAAVVAATILQCVWLARFPVAPASYPTNRESRQKIYAALREQSRRDARPLAIHLDGAWTVAVSMILEHDRDHVDFYIGERERWGFPGGRSATNVPNVRHVWLGDPWNPVPMASCLQVLAQEKDLTAYTSLSDVVRCP